MRLTLVYTWLSCLSVLISAANLADWQTRSIYQVVTDRYGLKNGSLDVACDSSLGVYCGGTWQGIINNLDYIQNMGFSAVWISPVVKQMDVITVDQTSYHGYWTQDMYSVNEAFGTPDDLKALSQALHDRGMYLMVDIVINHVAWAGNYTGVQYNGFVPFNDKKYYHDYCDISKDGILCWLGDGVVTLPDIKTEDPTVRQIYGTWASELVKNYTIDGLRIDAAGNVETAFFPSLSKSAGVFLMGEVYSGDPYYLCPYTKVMDSTLNYVTYFQVIRAFQAQTGSISDLAAQISFVQKICNSSSVSLGTFTENQDQVRIGHNTNDTTVSKVFLAYTFLTDGIPIVYQGQEQHFRGGLPPDNREAVWLSNYSTIYPLVPYVTSLNIIRNQFITVNPKWATTQMSVVYNDTHTIAIRKGPVGAQSILVLTNWGGSDKGHAITLVQAAHGFPAGTLVTDALNCVNRYVDGNGNLLVVIDWGLPKVLYATSNLSGSNVCINGATLQPSIVAKDPITHPAVQMQTSTPWVSSPATATPSSTSKSSASSICASHLLLVASSMYLLITIFA